PRRGGRRRADERDVVLVAAELHAAPAPAPTCWSTLTATRPAAAGVLQYLVAVHDVGDFLVPAATEPSGDERECGVALAGIEVAQSQTVPLEDPARQVRPVRPLTAPELEAAFGALGVAERRQKRVRGRHDLRGRCR